MALDGNEESEDEESGKEKVERENRLRSPPISSFLLPRAQKRVREHRAPIQLRPVSSKRKRRLITPSPPASLSSRLSHHFSPTRGYPHAQNDLRPLFTDRTPLPLESPAPISHSRLSSSSRFSRRLSNSVHHSHTLSVRTPCPLTLLPSSAYFTWPHRDSRQPADYHPTFNLAHLLPSSTTPPVHSIYLRLSPRPTGARRLPRMRASSRTSTSSFPPPSSPLRPPSVLLPPPRS